MLIGCLGQSLVPTQFDSVTPSQLSHWFGQHRVNSGKHKSTEVKDGQLKDSVTFQTMERLE
uniref:Uncharacterized protein n=1 Tax=Helianthus annuus TaxID=4232 RepID=A0A251TS74_HELAN